MSCGACGGTGSVAGMSGAPKLCPRCQRAAIADQREARRKAEAKRRAAIDPRRWLALVEEHSNAKDRAYLLAVIMATRANRSGFVSIPIDAMMRICRCGRRTIFYLLEKLIALGEIHEAQAGGGKGRHAVYRFTITKPSA